MTIVRLSFKKISIQCGKQLSDRVSTSSVPTGVLVQVRKGKNWARRRWREVMYVRIIHMWSW